LAKIGPVDFDFEINGLTEIVKNGYRWIYVYIYKKQKQNIQPAGRLLSAAGRVKKWQ